ncbi:MAG: hypothetical protein ACRYFY_19920 [Janthinobacterium lividum]
MTDVLGGSFRLGGDISFKSEFNNDISRSATGDLLLAPSNAYQIFNARTSFAWKNFEVSAYVKNIANRQYYAAQTIATAAGYYYGLPGEPRTFEVTFKVRY